MFTIKIRKSKTVSLLTALSMLFFISCSSSVPVSDSQRKVEEDKKSLPTQESSPQNDNEDFEKSKKSLVTLRNSVLDFQKFTKESTDIKNYKLTQKKINDINDDLTSFRKDLEKLSKIVTDQINFDEIEKLPLFDINSEQHKTLKLLAAKENRKAQEKLTDLGHYSNAVDDNDGPGQQEATKKMLESIAISSNPEKLLNDWEEILTTNQDNQLGSVTPQVTPSLKTSSNNDGWLYFFIIFNIVAIVSTAIIFYFLWSRLNEFVLIHKIPNSAKLQDEIKSFRESIEQIKDQCQDVRNQIQLFLKEKKIAHPDTTNLNNIFHITGQIHQDVERLRATVLYHQINLLEPVDEFFKMYLDSLNLELSSQRSQDNTQIQHLNSELKLVKDDIYDYKNSIQSTLDEIKVHLSQLFSKFGSQINRASHPALPEKSKDIQELKEERDLLSQKVQNLEKQIKYQRVERESNKQDLELSLQQSVATVTTLEQERDELSQLTKNLEQQIRDLQAEKGETQNLESSLQNSEEIIAILKQEKNHLSQSSKDLEQQIKALKIEKGKKEDLEYKLKQSEEKVVSLEKEKEHFIQTIYNLEQRIQSLEKRINKTAPKPGDVPGHWQSVITNYLRDPRAISNIVQDYVNEANESFMERRKDFKKAVVFSKSDSADGYYIVFVNSDYLLFPQEHAIPRSQADTALATFNGYKKGNTNKFTSIIPAQVSKLGNMWELKAKGTLDY